MTVKGTTPYLSKGIIRMAKFGKDDDAYAQQNVYIDNAIASSQADLDEKRDQLAQQQLAIVKAQGSPNWNPVAQKPAVTPKTTPGKTFTQAVDDFSGQKGLYTSATKPQQALGWRVLS
jgi:hypothetical protein